MCVGPHVCTCMEAWDWCVASLISLYTEAESYLELPWLASQLSQWFLSLPLTHWDFGGCHAYPGFMWILEIWSLVFTVAQYLQPNMSFWLYFIFLKVMSRGEMSCYVIQAGFQRLGSSNLWVPATAPSFVLAFIKTGVSISAQVARMVCPT